jgi:Sec-independent protein translocase protein TatA
MDEEESELDIVILSPWYRSWWAWILYMLIIGLLLFGRKRIARLFRGLGKKEKKPSAETSPADTGEEEEIEEAVMMEDDISQ